MQRRPRQAAFDSLLAQCLHNIVADVIVYNDCVEPVVRRPDRGQRLYCITVAMMQHEFVGQNVVEPFELSAPQGCVHVRHPVIEPNIRMPERSGQFDLGDIGEAADLISQFLVLCDDSPATARRDDLVAVETERSQGSVLPSHLSPERLCCVLDQRNAMLMTDREKTHDVAQVTEDMNADDSLNLVVCQPFIQSNWAEAAEVVAIDEVRFGPAVAYCVGSGYEGKSRDNDAIARFNFKCQQSEMKCSRSRRDSDNIIDPDRLANASLELFDVRAMCRL